MSSSDELSRLLEVRDRIVLRRRGKGTTGAMEERTEVNISERKKEGSGIVKKKRSNRAKKLARKLSRREKFEREDRQTKPGDIYLGHIPHGFYEGEMHRYFSQFGKVLKLRLSRSHRSGRSRGYAFIRFQCEEVAKIAAESMNNYLMYGKLLKCRVVSGRRQMFRSSKHWPAQCKRQEAMRRQYNRLQAVSSQQQYCRRLKNVSRREGKRQRRILARGMQYQCPSVSQLAATEPWSVMPSHKKFYNPDSDRSDSEHEG